MTIEEAIQYAEKKIDSASYRLEMGYLNNGLRQIVSNEYEFFMQALRALRQQEHFRDLTKKVEPLTLDELRSAYKFGYPVWLVGMEDGDGWVFIHHVDSCSVRYARIGTSEEWCFRTKSYGVRVWASRQKPEEGTV